MGLKDIQLSDLIVAEWYGDMLVKVPASPAAMTPPQPEPPPFSQTAAMPVHPPPAPADLNPAARAPIKFLGSNRRNITVLVESPGLPFLPDDQLAFLTRVLGACHTTIADTAIVNQASNPVTIAELKQQLRPKTMLLFGVDPAAIRLPINFPAFRPQAYDDCVFLSAPALDQLAPDTEETKLPKSKLWVCLKSMFNV